MNGIMLKRFVSRYPELVIGLVGVVLFSTLGTILTVGIPGTALASQGRQFIPLHREVNEREGVIQVVQDRLSGACFILVNDTITQVTSEVCEVRKEER